MIVHLAICVKGVQRWSDKQLEALFTDNVSPTKGRVIRQWLKLKESQGILKLPIGDPCEGWSDQTGCQGHEQEGTPC